MTLGSFRPVNYIFADEKAFVAMEKANTSALDAISFSWQMNGHCPGIYAEESTTLYSLALLKAHRYGLENPSAENVARALGKVLAYEFDPSTHTHTVDISWIESEGDISSTLVLSANVVEERCVLKILPDSNCVLRTHVEEVMRN